MGQKVFRKMQFGIESVHGTPVAADTMLVGESQPIAGDRAAELIEEDIGVRARGYRTRVGDTILVQDMIRLPNLYFQAIPALFSCGIVGGVTPAEQSSGEGDYLWDFDPSMTGDNTPDSMTLELGDDTQAYEREYLMFERFRLQAEIPQAAEVSPVLLEGHYFARQTTPTTFTGALSLPTTENVVGKLVRFYRDAAWGSVGGTEKTGLLRSFNIDLMTGLHPKMMGGANRTFDLHGQDGFDFVATFNFEGGSEADAIWDAARAGTFQVVRLEVEGAAIGGGDNHKFTLDLGGFWQPQSVIPLASDDRGNSIHSAILAGQYDPTGAKILQAQVVTNVSAI